MLPAPQWTVSASDTMVDFGAQSLHLRCGSMTPASRATQPLSFFTPNWLNGELSVGPVANLYPSRTHTYKNSYAFLGTPILLPPFHLDWILMTQSLRNDSA
jgi:hypothetical protein